MFQRDGNALLFAVGTIFTATLKNALLENVHPSSNLMTDEAVLYKKIGKNFASHKTVNHANYESARGNVTTNRIEGFFGLF